MYGDTGFTKVQQEMLDILDDGLPHTRLELHACLPDPESALSSIQRHIAVIRKLIRPVGHDLICELVHRRICYRHVRLLRSPNDD